VDNAQQQAIAAATPGGPPVVQPLNLNGSKATIIVQKFSGALIGTGFSMTTSACNISLPVGLPINTSGPISVGLTVFGDTKALDNGVGNAKASQLGILPIRIELMSTSGSLRLSGLTQPIAIRMPVQNTSSLSAGLQLKCVYWDELQQAWSQEGIETAGWEGNSMICKTSHLSFFAGIWSSALMSISCSNLMVFSQRSFQLFIGLHLERRRRWYAHPAGMLSLSILLFDVVLIVLSIFIDIKYKSHGQWRKDALFVETHEVKVKKQKQDALLTCVMNHILASDAAARAGITLQDMQLVLQQRQRVAHHKAHASAAEKGSDHEENHRASQHQCQQTYETLLGAHGVQLQKLDHVLDKSMVGNASLATMCSMILNLHPIMRIWRFSVVFTCCTRALLLTCSTWGALMASSLFFSTSGGAVSLEDPAACASPAIPYVTVMVSGILSTLLSQLSTVVITLGKKRKFRYRKEWAPNAKRKILLKQDIRDIILDIFLIFYSLFAAFYVFLFLANVTDTDRTSWLISTFVSIIQSWLLMPIVVSVLLAKVPRVRQFQVVQKSWLRRTATMSEFSSNVSDFHSQSSHTSMLQEELFLPQARPRFQFCSPYCSTPAC